MKTKKDYIRASNIIEAQLFKLTKNIEELDLKIDGVIRTVQHVDSLKEQREFLKEDLRAMLIAFELVEKSY